MTQKPPLRLFHSMARSGGTVFSRCLGAMQKAMLLSEVHFQGNAYQNPLNQAQDWYGLFSPQDLRNHLASGQLRFVRCIDLIHAKAHQKGYELLLRDWSHLDFLGFPLIDRPCCVSQTANVLAHHRQCRIANIRHPVDQWLSMEATGVFGGKLAFDDFAVAWTRFSEMALKIGYVRFEDFLAEPSKVIEKMCRQLEMTFDPTFIERYQSYPHVTGDLGGSGSRGAGQELTKLKRRETSTALVDACLKHRGLRDLTAELGYDLQVEVVA